MSAVPAVLRAARHCHPDVAEVLVTAPALRRRVRALGARITADYAGQEIVLVGVLKGALVFLADLARAIALPVTIDFVAAASYGAGTVPSGAVRLTRDVEEPLTGRHVLVVDTVLDTGHTLRAIDVALRPREPASLRYCVLLAKQRPGPPPFVADYVGFTIPDRFVVGYGLDYAQRYRNLPCVAVLRAEVYAPGALNTGEGNS